MAINKAKMKCNKPRRTPDGPKKFVVKACQDGTEKIIRYGDPNMKIRKNINKIHSALTSNFDNFHICYTIKANSNPNIIGTLKSEIPSLGADCSSPGELYAAKLGGISSNDCIFTGNYESQEDLEIAFER